MHQATTLFLFGALALTTVAAPSPAPVDPAPASAASPPKPPSKYSSIVIFGDSFSDNGNEYALSNRTWPADPAYYMGRFSNGPEWNELVAKNLSIPLHNYAYGGATSSNKIVQGYSGAKADLPVPSLDEQVDRFLKNPPRDAPFDTSLFALLGGANDVFFNVNASAAQAVGVLSQLTTRLRNAGARNFLLLNYPDLAMIPYDSYVPYPDQQNLGRFSESLSHELTSLTASLRGGSSASSADQKKGAVSVAFLDLLPEFKKYAFYAGGWKPVGFDQFGLYGSCLTGAYMEAPRTLCNDPDRRVFWDEYHPTRRSHQLIAEMTLNILKV